MQSSNFGVRRATESDADGVVALARSFGVAGDVTESQMAVAFHRLVDNPAVFLAVADDGTQLVGYVLAQDYLPGLRSDFATGRISDLFVQPAARKSGFGRALMGAVQQSKSLMMTRNAAASTRIVIAPIGS